MPELLSDPPVLNHWDKKTWVTKEELRELGRVPTGKVILAILATWGVLLAFLQFALMTDSWLIDAVSFVVIGFAFVYLSYWAHEGTHQLLSANRGTNDLVTDLFLAGPLGMSVGHHRWLHLRHHAYVNDPAGDVDTSGWICVRGGRLFLETFLHLIGWHAIVTILRYRRTDSDPRFSDLPRRSLASHAAFVVWNSAIFALCALQGQWYMYFLLWVMPLFGISVAVINLGNIVEHQPSSDVCDVGIVKLPRFTRMMRAGWLERNLFAPVGFFYHFEHHQFPSVPAFRLPELRRLLEQRERFSEPDVIWTDGYLRTLWRLAMDKTFGIRLIPKPEGVSPASSSASTSS